ncbi:MAG: glycosyltransferase [Candidatus Helarchaeota archaeon]|nr:glycosyltransferase [Candidatus Helarchaeota archaeon]
MLNILVIQDTDWIERGPHQQHHIFERLGRKGYSIWVIDFEILWDKYEKKSYFQKEKIFQNISHVVANNKIEVKRPPILKIPLLDKMTIPIFHTISINKIIKNKRIQVIVGQTILNTFCGLILSKIYRIPFIYHVIDSIHSIASDYIPKYFLFLAKVLEVFIIKHSDLIITVNKGLKDYIIRLGGSPEKTFIVPAGVDFKKYQESKDRSRIRKKLGIKEDDLILFFMGWLYEFSGLKELAEYILKHPKLQAKLLAVGGGDLYPYLLSLSKKTDKIIVTGQVPYDEIPIYLSAADICILPAYKNEIMMNIVPIKLIEYMAAGKPVISTKLPGVFREFGKNNGILYCDNVGELVQIALKLKENNKIEGIGKRGLNYVKKRDWTILVKDFEKIMKRTIKNRKKG